MKIVGGEVGPKIGAMVKGLYAGCQNRPFRPPARKALPLRTGDLGVTCYSEVISDHFTGMKTGVFCALSSKTRNFAGFVLLAFRPIV
jgi:hypothetical protein